MSASFWKLFGIGVVSSIDTLLSREEVTLEELFDEDDLLNECKYGNKQLLEFMLRDESLVRLFQILTQTPEEDAHPKVATRYPYLAAEILCTEGWWVEMSDALCNKHPELLLSLWEYFLQAPPLNVTQATHISRVAITYFERKPDFTLQLLQSKTDLLDKLISHIGLPPIVDLLLKLIACSETAEGAIVMEWLASANLVPKLVGKLDPKTATPAEQESVSEALTEVIVRAEARSLIAKLESADTFSTLFKFVVDSDGDLSHVEHILTLTIKLLERSIDGPFDFSSTIDNLPVVCSSVIPAIPLFVKAIRAERNIPPFALSHGKTVPPVGPIKLKAV